MAAGAGNHLLSHLRRQGAEPHPGGEGTRFRVWSSCAHRIELCLFDVEGRETGRTDLEPESDGDWSTFLEGVGPGQAYGYRAHGAWAPDQGLRANPAKLLLDPYARQINGEFRWAAAVFDYAAEVPGGWQISELDSAPFVPRSVVCARPAPVQRGAMQRWSESIILETNVRGFTMRHPELTEAERGRFAGLSNARIIDYLKALGITSIELQPVHSWIDEHHLAHRGLRNFWGYNSIGFFAPDQRLAGPEPIAEFRAMVASLHEAGLEVLLDVAYNHTGESDALGPTLSFRGLDNLAYYRVEPGDAAVYINDTGTGNTLNADQPRVQALILNSLEYWHQCMGVDGFRFDLAPILGRHAHGFDPSHPLLDAIGSAPALADVRLIAEPWDPGPGGYQLGNFPDQWSEWNDRYRDVVRQFWRGDDIRFEELARRLDGSKDVFRPPGRGSASSINFITAHDGFTLADLVSYRHRHNEANGEQNRDGHQHNYSDNHGIEGPTSNRVVLARRRRQRLNLLGTLLLSQGIPMLLAGDEAGHSQSGNNNAYAQDNEFGWLDWARQDEDEAFLQAVRKLIALRNSHAVLSGGDAQRPVIVWYAAGGELLGDLGGGRGNVGDWAYRRAALQVLFASIDANKTPKMAVYINGHDHEVEFQLPPGGVWACAWSSAAGQPIGPVAPDEEGSQTVRVAAWSMGLFVVS